MRTAAYDLDQFAPQKAREKLPVKVVDNPKRKKTSRAYGARLALLSVLVLVLMTFTVYNNMLLTETKSAVTSKENELSKLESEYSYLNYQLESSVSLKNAEEYAVNELGLVKMNASQVEYVNLRSTSTIEENDGLADIGFFGGIWNTVLRVFKQ